MRTEEEIRSMFNFIFKKKLKTDSKYTDGWFQALNWVISDDCTCYSCLKIDCAVRNDPYNINGDCLGEK